MGIGVLQTPTPTPYNYPIQDTIWNFFAFNIYPIIVLIGVIIIIIFVIAIIRHLKKNSKKNMLMSYKDFNTGKFKAKFYRKIANVYHEIGTEDIQIDGGDKGDKFKFKDVDFTTFDRNNVAFADNDNKYYAFDFDTKEQINFHKPNNPPQYKQIIELIDNWINKNVIKQLTEGLEVNSTGSTKLILAIFISLIIGLISGALIGYFSHTPTTVIQETPKAFVEALKYVMP